MAYRSFLIVFLACLIPGYAFSQSENYNLDFAPDAWYNSVDGVRLGLRLSGEMEGTFNDGPHRLNAGVWLGTAFPDLPVSYFLSFTEPIPAISSFGNEGNIRLVSSIRTGYNRQQISLNKRWQNGFNELEYKEVSLSFSQEKLIDTDYRPFPELWQNEWKSLVGLTVLISEINSLGKFDANLSFQQNVHSSSGNFSVGKLELRQKINLGEYFQLRLRGFGGITSDAAAPEYLFAHSFRQPVEWLNNGVSRARGTLPQAWLEDGLFHISGGANLRGYTDRDFNALENGNLVLFTRTASINTEIEFPNPINNLLDTSIIGDFVRLSSYAFFDTGIFSRNDFMQTSDIQTDIAESMSDAGIGIQFSINIPDYLGKDRGLAIRYEIPFWLSHPFEDNSNFKYRSLIGIGAVISL